MIGAPAPGDEPHTWTLAFAAPAREAAFLDDYAREIRGFYRIALVAVLALWSASVGFDLQADAADRTPLFAIRFGAVTPVLVAALVGLVIALIQAATQIQEQTLQYAVKFFAIVLTIFITASLMGGSLYQFTERVMTEFPALVRK